tara:strand:+ start:203 stop:622 length:420 start_codon:yes stop_codon:yes gene_type:complete
MPRKYTKKKKTTKSSASKTQEKEMIFADGKAAEDRHKLACDIEEILGTTPSNPFGTTSASVFEEKLSGMNLTQMQELAVKASVFPSGNKTTLKNKLKKDFVQRYGKTERESNFVSQAEAPIASADSGLAEKIKDILENS